MIGELLAVYFIYSILIVIYFLYSMAARPHPNTEFRFTKRIWLVACLPSAMFIDI